MIKRFLFISYLVINVGILAAIYILLFDNPFSYFDFRVNYTGALDGKFTGKGHFVSCVGSPLRHEITLFGKSKLGNDISFSLPVHVTPGTYTLWKSDIPGVTFTASGDLTDKRGKFYIFGPSDLVAGTIGFTAVPYDSGLPIQGNFSMSVYIEELSNTVDIEGSFDFSGSGDSNYDCF